MNIDNVDLTKKMYLLTGENDKMLIEAREALLRSVWASWPCYICCDNLPPSQVPFKLWECMISVNKSSMPAIIPTHSPIVAKALNIAILASNLRKEINNDKMLKCIFKMHDIKIPFEALIPVEQIGVYYVYHGIVVSYEDSDSKCGIYFRDFVHAENWIDSQKKAIQNWIDGISDDEDDED